jgi:hypothetical protein
VVKPLLLVAMLVNLLLAGGMGAAKTIQGGAGSGIGKSLIGLADSDRTQQALERAFSGMNFGFGSGSAPSGGAGYGITPDQYQNYLERPKSFCTTTSICKLRNKSWQPVP